jgi:hypothetical protein
VDQEDAVTNYGQLPKQKLFRPPERLSRGGSTTAFERKREKPLTGMVKERQAQEGEERLAREFYKGIVKAQIRDFYFEWSPGVPEGLPGWRQLDYMVFGYGKDVAIAIDDVDFVHRSAKAKNHDKVGDMLFLERLNKLGYDIREIKHIPASDLATQEGAAKVYRELFG